MNMQAGLPRCPVCGAGNSEHATVCAACGSFLQNRVPTLDLFSTAWGMLERPVTTLRTVARAEHKNYALVLFGLGGLLPGMLCFHLFGVGRYVASFVLLLPLGVLTGMILGLLSAPLAAAAIAATSRMAGGDGSFRNALGVAAYALVPVIGVAIITLPIQWLTFGEYLYTLNPHPATINAVSYWSLNALQGAAALWTFVLLFQGVRVGMRVRAGKVMLPWVTVVVVVAGAWMAVFGAAESVLRSISVNDIF